MKSKKDFEDEEFIPEEDGLNSEEIDIEEMEAKEADTLKNVKEKLKKCQQEKQENLEALQKSKADFLNSKRRLGEQLSRDTERVTNTFVERLLPLCDSFDHAMGDSKMWEQCDESWKKGIEAIHAQLTSILKTYHVVSVGEVGEPFDPNLHEAVSTEENSEHEPDTVIEVLQKGYKREENLIRPAKVVISN